MACWGSICVVGEGVKGLAVLPKRFNERQEAEAAFPAFNENCKEAIVFLELFLATFVGIRGNMEVTVV